MPLAIKNWVVGLMLMMDTLIRGLLTEALEVENLNTGKSLHWLAIALLPDFKT